MEDYLNYRVQNSSVNCTNYTPTTSHVHIFPYITIVSSTASIFGSSLIILTYLMWRDIRTVARTIVVFLAVADLLTAVGYLFGAIVFLRYKPDDANFTYSSSRYKSLCEAQSFITTTFPISSFLWTSHLAVYLFVTIVLQRNEFAKKLGDFFHLTAWGIPLLACVPALIVGQLGDGSARTSTTWCFVFYNSTYPGSEGGYRTALAKYYGFELLCGKFWEILTCVIALVLYVTVKISIYRRKRVEIVNNYSYGSLNMDKRVSAAISQIDHKLIWIPVVFILLRLWGTIRFFISFQPQCHFPCPPSSPEDIIVTEHCSKSLYFPLLMGLQSAGDPAQGWGNALLFVIFNKTISKRLCPCAYALGNRAKRCLDAFAERCSFHSSCCCRCSQKSKEDVREDSPAQDRLALYSSTNASTSGSSSSYGATGMNSAERNQKITRIDTDSSTGSTGRVSDREK